MKLRHHRKARQATMREDTARKRWERTSTVVIRSVRPDLDLVWLDELTPETMSALKNVATHGFGWMPKR